jgi:flagellar motor switch protein FliN
VSAESDLKSDRELRPDRPGAPADLTRVLDIPVQLSVELGRTKMPIRQILQLGAGSVVELGTTAGELVDVLVNGHLIAQGEIVVMNGKFGVRLTDVVTATERVARLSKN